jgi:hypothetical protein
MTKKVKPAYARLSYPDDSIALWLQGRRPITKALQWQARRNLARMFRDQRPWDPAICLMLADAVDPDGESGLRLCLKRKRGRKRRVSQQEIAALIWRQLQINPKLEAAIQTAVKELGVVRSTVTAAWRKWRPHFEAKPSPINTP